jgi:hypothetical protein
VAGVIHRDLKPSNVLIGPDGVAKLADFGIAKGLDLTGLTGTSTLLGTPAYLAPEGPLDERSDLYSLGIIAFELLSGFAPFAGSTYQEVIVRHIREAPDLGKLPPEARDVVGWLLAKDPAARPQSAAELVNALNGTAIVRKQPQAPVGLPAVAHATPAPDLTSRRPDRDLALREKSRRRPALAGLGAVAVVVCVVAAVLVIGAPDQTPNASPAVLHVPTGAGATLSGSGTFVSTGSMTVARGSQTASLLPDGRILIAGGSNRDNDLASAELYDTKTGAFAATGSMTTGRSGHSATALPGGLVLIAGGGDYAGGTTNYHASAELYDTKSGSFTLTGSMATARAGHSATLLTDGRVLIMGGLNGPSPGGYLASAEVYDPNTGAFTTTRSMATARASYTATLLADGRVLVTGGTTDGLTALASATLYDPKTGAFSPTGSLATPRFGQTATLLADGRVLVAGGYNTDSKPPVVASAELYDPKTGSFTPTGSMTTSRASQTATLLPDGRVLVVGGDDANKGLATVEIYDAKTGIFSATGSMTIDRDSDTATPLPTGQVLLAGGWSDKTGYLSSAELYTP